MSTLLERLLARAQAGVSEVTTCKVTPRELRDLVREGDDSWMDNHPSTWTPEQKERLLRAIDGIKDA